MQENENPEGSGGEGGDGEPVGQIGVVAGAESPGDAADGGGEAKKRRGERGVVVVDCGAEKRNRS